MISSAAVLGKERTKKFTASKKSLIPFPTICKLVHADLQKK